MTYEELMSKLLIEKGSAIGDAILAVVELHKPKKKVLQNGINAGNFAIGCATCISKSRYETANAKYPCLTIQAIEKELA